MGKEEKHQRARTPSERRSSIAESSFLLSKRQCRTVAQSPSQNLELAPIGNCAVFFLADRRGAIVYGCTPHMDSDPIFAQLLHNDRAAASRPTLFEVEIENFAYAESEYFPLTAVLVTRLFDTLGNSLRVTDFCPFFEHHGRVYNPPKLVRLLKPCGSPRIRVRLHINEALGATAPARAQEGPSHLSFASRQGRVRLTTDVPVSFITQERFFVATKNYTLHLDNDLPLEEDLARLGRLYFEKTVAHWTAFSRALFLPLEWQDEVVRAAITLKLCQNWSTGAIVAAMTTSIPESDDGAGRNWDYRFCWVRDSYHTLQALNRLGQTQIMERYLDFILNLMHAKPAAQLQPLYGLGLEARLEERTVPALAGYRGLGPVRVGNAAFSQRQNDTYGSIILSVKQLFFDSRLRGCVDPALFGELEAVGEVAFACYRTPDAGIWELRGSEHVHTHSVLMCWAACASLAQIAEILKEETAQPRWLARAAEIEEYLKEFAWSEKFGTYLAVVLDPGVEADRRALEGLSEETLPLDSTLLLLGTLGLCEGNDPRFAKTVDKVGQTLMREGFLWRYRLADDFGVPKNAFVVCTFWYIEALALLGRRDEARAMFEHLLDRRNHFGILSEDFDVERSELWGNFPQAYSMVGIINSALLLSKPWSSLGL